VCARGGGGWIAWSFWDPSAAFQCILLFASSFTSPSSVTSIFRRVVARKLCGWVGARVVTATQASRCQMDLKQSSCSTGLVVVGVMVVVVVVVGDDGGEDHRYGSASYH